MSEELVVLGFFKGRYKTEQGVALGMSDTFPATALHKVNVYEGSLKTTSFFKVFNPEEHIKLSSLELTNVPNVEIESGKDAPFANTRVYEFKKLIIIDPKIISSYDLNGKTYGELEGLAYGQTEKNPTIKRLNPEDYGDGEGTGVVTPIPPQPTDYDPVPDPFMTKVTDTGNKLRVGCLENMWRIIGYILLFLLLWFLFKTCNKIKNDDDTCNQAVVEQMKVEKEKARLDSIRSGMNETITQTISNISEIYFYQNTTDFHISSIGVNSTLDRLVNVMKTFPESRFLIIGHHSGIDIEQTGIDLKRAEKVIDYLVSKGVKKSQLEIATKGDSELHYDRNIAHDFEGRGFNNNMRVKVELIVE